MELRNRGLDGSGQGSARGTVETAVLLRSKPWKQMTGAVGCGPEFHGRGRAAV